MTAIEALADTYYMENFYAVSDQLRNNGGLTLVSKEFFGFGRYLMKEVSEFQINSFILCGNQAIAEGKEKILKDEQLRKIFRACYRESLKKDGDLQMIAGDDDLMDLYHELWKKVFHVWVGEQTLLFKNKYTGRLATNTTSVSFRGELNTNTKKEGKTEESMN